MKIELKSIDEFVKENEEQEEKDKLAIYLMQLQNSIYVNVGLSAKDVESIVANTNTQDVKTDIDKIIKIVAADINKRINAELQDIDDIVLHYKYYRVKVLYYALLTEKLLQQNKQLTSENIRLEAIAKPKLDGLQKYREEIKQAETKRVKDQILKGMSACLDRTSQIMVEKYFYKMEKGE